MASLNFRVGSTSFLGEGGLYSLFIHKSLIGTFYFIIFCFNWLAFKQISVILFILLALFILENDANGIIIEHNDEIKQHDIVGDWHFF